MRHSPLHPSPLPRAFSASIALALSLGWSACAGAAETASAAGAAPPTRTSVVFVPGSPDRDAPVWDSLAVLENRQQWAVSESVATALAAQLEAAPEVDSLALAHALLYVANARTKLRNHADGKGFAALERSIAIRTRNGPPGDPALAWSHMLGATFYTEAGHPELAAMHAEAGARLIEAHPPVDLRLLTQCKLGLATALTALGRMDEARVPYEAALALREALDGHESRAIVPMLAEYGLFLSRIGDFDRARELLGRAVAIGERDTTPHSDYLEGSLSRLSTVENRAGNLAESLELAMRAHALARRNSGEHSVSAVRMRTIVAYRLVEFGDFAGAAGHLREIVPAMTAALGESHPQTLNARLTLVECLLESGDTTGVGGEFAAVRAGLRGQQRLANSNASYLKMLAADYARLRGDAATARDSLLAAIELEWEKNDALGATLAMNYGRLLRLVRDAGDLEVLEATARGMTRLADSTQARATPEWIALMGARAAAEARAGRDTEAWAYALEAEHLARERLRYQLQALPDARALQFAQGTGEATDALVELARADQPDRVATAWDRVIRWRGRVRHEIARRRPAAAASADTAVAGAHARWIAAQRRLAQLVVSGAGHPDDPSGRSRYENARHAAEEAERRYVRAARAAVAPDEPASLERVLAALAPGQALVAFAEGSVAPDRRTLHAFVGLAGDPVARRVTLGAVAEVEDMVSAWQASLARPATNTSNAAAAEQEARWLGDVVRRRVWDPVADVIGDANEVLIVGEGPLAEVPWLALPGARRGYLADEPRVMHVLIAERDLLRDGAAPATAGSGLLAVGDPDYAGAGPVRGDATVLAMRAPWSPCADALNVPLPSLPGARLEVQDLVRTWPAGDGPATLLEGAAADEAGFKRHAPGRAVLHLATHGVVVNDRCEAAGMPDAIAAAGATRGVGGVAVVGAPARAGREKPPAAAAEHRPAPRSPLGRAVWLAFAGAARQAGEASDENEGLLTAEEVVTLDLRGTDWVVLSACQSGVAPAWAREGVLGMRRAFHVAGARAVIASRWPVGDESTREWMAALYAARAAGSPAGAAVGQACRAVLEARRRDGRTTHPFYWAAFGATTVGL